MNDAIVSVAEASAERIAANAAWLKVGAAAFGQSERKRCQYYIELQLRIPSTNMEFKSQFSSAISAIQPLSGIQGVSGLHLEAAGREPSCLFALKQGTAPWPSL
jgi:hypothetical protein